MLEVVEELDWEREELADVLLSIYIKVVCVCVEDRSPGQGHITMMLLEGVGDNEDQDTFCLCQQSVYTQKHICVYHCSDMQYFQDIDFPTLLPSTQASSAPTQIASFNAASPATPRPYTATPHRHPAIQRTGSLPLQTTHRASLHGPRRLHRIRSSRIHACIPSSASRRPSPHFRKGNL